MDFFVQHLFFCNAPSFCKFKSLICLPYVILFCYKVTFVHTLLNRFFVASTRSLLAIVLYLSYVINFFCKFLNKSRFFHNLYNGHAILCRFREQRRNLEEDVEEIKKAGITDVMVLMQVRLMTSSSFSYIVTMFCRLQSFASTECLDYSRSTPRRVLRSTTYPWRMDVCPASLFFWKQSLGYKR